MLLKNFLISLIVIIFATAPAVFSQQPHSQPDAPDKSRYLSINEDNLYCFQNLQCLKEENPFKNSNLEDIKLNNSMRKYVIEGKSKNEELYAEYNGVNGNLIKATVIQKDIALPKNILLNLVSGEFKSWKMVGNKRIIKNFAEDSIRYEVILMKEGELRIEYFNRDGVTENQLS